jgi:hypothetical protein
MQGDKVQAKQWCMALAGASMMALALPLWAAPPEDDTVTTAVYLGQANAAASLENWAEAAGFFEQAFGTVKGDVSDEAYPWLVEAGDDWMKIGDRAHAANAYRHAAEVAGTTGRLYALVSVQSKLADTLTDIDDHHAESAKNYHRGEAIGKLLAAGPAYPKDGPGWIKSSDLGQALVWSRLKGDDTGARLMLPDVSEGGGAQQYIILEPNGRRESVTRKGAINWIKAAAEAAR